MSEKLCPHCRREFLAVTHYQDEELDICPKCSGIWFEQGELNSLISAVDNGENRSDYQALLGQRIGRTEMRCPNCRVCLHNFKLLQDYDVGIDICPECDGAWVEADDLDKVEHSPRIRHALDELNKKVSVKSWIFQFMARMPVEYNVKPHRKPLVTWALIFINVAIFFAYGGSVEREQWVYNNFAYTPVDIAAGEELWTLLTSVFLHGDLMHLLGNMYFLYVIGDNLEDVLGRWRYLGIYLASGLGASIISLGFSWGSDIPNLGASGAISALFGMYLVWFRYASISYMFIIYQKKLSAFWYFAIWLVYNNIWGIVQGIEGVGFWAHIGGFVIGLLIGVVLKAEIFRRNPLVRILSEERIKIRR